MFRAGTLVQGMFFQQLLPTLDDYLDVKMRGNVVFCYLNCVFELITHRDKMMNQQCDTSLNSE